MGENSPRKLDRPTAALLGAVLMVMTGSLTRVEAARAIDLSTISLLFGMMVLLSVLIQSKTPVFFAHRALGRCQSAHKLLAGVIFASGIASALMLNDTVCLLGTPILLEVVIQAGLPATPFLLALATSSNIGSAMTLIGNPQNMIIGHLSGWSWSGFVLRMLPIGLVCLVVDWLIISFMFRKELAAVDMQAVCMPDKEIEIKRKPATRSLIMFAAFIFAIILGAPMDFAAVAAAALLLVWVNRPPKLTLEMVDWSLLLFFAGLFVVVEGLLKADRTILEACLNALGTHSGLGNIVRWSATTVIGSNIFSNVPFVLIASHWIDKVSDPKFFWLILSLTSTLAGNLTLFGSVANVIVAQRSQSKSPLSFWDFFRVGVPVTIITTAIGVGMLWAFHLLGWV
ncbi:MAG: SLC13 family permease [Armatimonadota bacterium]|nr:anion transporter [bacterium]